jgi:multicomponent Na+:H+ antiporter subunit G
MLILAIIGQIFIIIGTVFLFLGALGLLRMPDVYNRIQAGTKATTLGSLAVLIGVAILNPAWGLKLFLLAIFILLSSPVGSSTIARAAYISGIKPFAIHPNAQEKN